MQSWKISNYCYVESKVYKFLSAWRFVELFADLLPLCETLIHTNDIQFTTFLWFFVCLSLYELFRFACSISSIVTVLSPDVSTANADPRPVTSTSVEKSSMSASFSSSTQSVASVIDSASIINAWPADEQLRRAVDISRLLATSMHVME